jgi:condensin-2 complex subunit D3
MQVYRTLLKHMTDEQRFATCARLTQHVLGAVVDGVMPLAGGDADGAGGGGGGGGAVITPHRGAAAAAGAPGTIEDLLVDVFAILGCPEARLAKRGGGGGGDADAEELEAAGAAAAGKAAVAVAKAKVMSALTRRNTMENVVPVLIALKHQLAAARSPLMGRLMQYLKLLFTEYKDDVADMLAADKQLAEEVAYDLRLYDAAQRDAAAAAAAALQVPATAAPAAAAAAAGGGGTPAAKTPDVKRARRPANDETPFSPPTRGSLAAAAAVSGKVRCVRAARVCCGCFCVYVRAYM